MKRIMMLAIMAAFLFGVVGTSYATDLAVSGSWRIAATWSDNWDFQDSDDDDASEDDFRIRMRARTKFEFITSEDLKAVLHTEIGDIAWGQPNAGDLGTDAVAIEVKELYVDFNWPDTDVNIKAGLMGVALPSNFGSPVLDDDFATLNITVPFNDMFTMVAGFARFADDQNGIDADGANVEEDEFDALYLVGVISGDGFTIQPYFVWAWLGADADYVANNNANARTDEIVNPWWLGVSLSVNAFDPFTFYLDLVYGALDDEAEANDAAGWFVDLAVDYDLEVVTPRLGFYYGTGEDGDAADGSEQMPSVSAFFVPTTFWYDGGRVGEDMGEVQGTGKFGIWFSLMNFSFMDELSHTFTIHWAKGTNDEDSALANVYDLSEDEHMWELNLDTQYNIYENLALMIELGYVNVDYDDDTTHGGVVVDDEEDAYKCTIGVRYDF